MKRNKKKEIKDIISNRIIKTEPKIESFSNTNGLKDVKIAYERAFQRYIDGKKVIIYAETLEEANRIFEKLENK